MSVSARRNDVVSIAPILVWLSRILHNNGTATAVLAIPVPPPLLGVISRVHQPTQWCAGMVVVPKKSGSVRICVDFRRFNESVLRETYPLPKVDTCTTGRGNRL